VSAPKLRVGVHGAAGRMGRAIVKAVLEAADLELVAAVDREGAPGLGSDAGELALAGRAGLGVSAGIDALRRAEVIIDFSAPSATAWLAEQLASDPRPLVVGTTGLDGPANTALTALSSRAAVLVAPNTSIGVNVLFQLTRKVAQALDADFDIEIVEMHHKHKVDAPSGTALMLGEAAATGRGVSLKDASVRVRDGHTGARRRVDIGFATLRGGSVIGEHTVIFAADGERIELTHKASDRSLFARGAVRSALWARGRGPGLFSMTDVLGL